jgi:hypothetical protein
MSETWIFQTSSEYYDIERHFAHSQEPLIWIVKQHAKRISEGDTIYLWQSTRDKRQESAIFARGKAVSGVEALQPAAIPSFWKKDLKAKFGVQIELDPQCLINRITLSEFRRDRILSQTEKIRKGQGTNFWVSPDEAKHLNEIFNQRLGKCGKAL